MGTKLIKGVDVLEVLKKLPEMVYTRSKSNPKQVIAIKRGVMGFYPIATSLSPEDLNPPTVTKAQIEAMENGSMFGWECPVANPDNYDEVGKLYWKGEHK